MSDAPGEVPFSLNEVDAMGMGIDLSGGGCCGTGVAAAAAAQASEQSLLDQLGFFDDPNVCIVCGEPRYMRHRFCKPHKSLAESLRVDAERQDLDKTKATGTKTTECSDAHKEAMADPARCVMKMKMAEEANPSASKGKKRIKFDHMDHAHSFRKQNVAEDFNLLKKVDFIEFSTTMERKRRWTPARSLQEWDKLKDDPSIGRDNLGQEKGFELRLHLKKGDYVKVGTASIEEKSLTNTSKKMKSASADELSQMRAELSMGMQTFGGDFHSVGASSSSANSSSPAASMEGAGGGGTPNGKQPPPLDMALRANTSSKIAREQDLEIVKLCEAALKGQEAIERKDVSMADDKAHFDIVQQRLNMLLLVLLLVHREPNKELPEGKVAWCHQRILSQEKLMKLFVTSIVADSPANDVVDVEKEVNIEQNKIISMLEGSAYVPIENPQSLKNVGVIAMLAHQVTTMESTATVKSALSNWVETKLAWKQLAKALNKSITDLNGNIKRRFDAQKTEQKARVRINTDIFKLKVEADMVAPVHRSDAEFLDGAPQVDYTKPFVVVSAAVQNFAEGKLAQPMLQRFLAQYKGVPQFKDPTGEGRIFAPVSAATVAQAMKSLIHTFVPKENHPNIEPTVVDMKKLTWPWLWGMREDLVHSSPESHGLGSIRIVLGGGVSIMCLIGDAATGLSLGINVENALLESNILRFSCMSQEDLTKMKGQVFYMSAPTHSVVYLPPGCHVIMAPTNKPCNMYGFKQLVMPESISPLQMTKMMLPWTSIFSNSFMLKDRNILDAMINVWDPDGAFRQTKSEELKVKQQPPDGLGDGGERGEDLSTSAMATPVGAPPEQRSPASPDLEDLDGGRDRAPGHSVDALFDTGGAATEGPVAAAAPCEPLAPTDLGVVQGASNATEVQEDGEEEGRKGTPMDGAHGQADQTSSQEKDEASREADKKSKDDEVMGEVGASDLDQEGENHGVVTEAALSDQKEGAALADEEAKAAAIAANLGSPETAAAPTDQGPTAREHKEAEASAGGAAAGAANDSLTMMVDATAALAGGVTAAAPTDEAASAGGAAAGAAEASAPPKKRSRVTADAPTSKVAAAAKTPPGAAKAPTSFSTAAATKAPSVAKELPPAPPAPPPVASKAESKKGKAQPKSKGSLDPPIAKAFRQGSRKGS
ncbi:unnamed protein product [Prorocentrum cordatum]|uniref:Uncharacterized protein n=1 Tax=Prorocentrum cordatum TaxID=2364126 RepID=A0ABN9UD08_9DINO|nr:unnamed protein product [Polarella glacialis]